MREDPRLPKGVWIDGEWLEDASGGRATHVNPTTGKPQRTFPLAGRDEVERAISAARRALPSWAAHRGEDRRDLLRDLAARVRDHAGDFAEIGALEMGAPATPGVALSAAAWLEYYAGWADKIGEAIGGYVEVSPERGTDYVVPEPVGVVGAIITWNAPAGFLGMSLAPALAAGCCVVVKAPDKAPFSSVRFAQLCEDAGFPRGVVNVLPGGVEAGEALAAHPDVDKITFTGGPATASEVLRSCAGALTPTVMELGGKSANIVFDDADIERAAMVAARYTFNAGQGCSLPTRLLVHEKVYDEVVDRVVGHVEAVVVGDPLDPSTQMGPVIDEAACNRILGMVERAIERGDATLLTGGVRLDGDLADGYFVAPTVLGAVDPDAEIAQEEIFGPVLCVSRFRDEDEAVAMANGTAFGLAAYVQTSDVSRAQRMTRLLRAGSVHVNGSGPGPVGPPAPFGGTKRSGFGRQGGRAGLLEFLHLKNVLINR